VGHRDIRRGAARTRGVTAAVAVAGIVAVWTMVGSLENASEPTPSSSTANTGTSSNLQAPASAPTAADSGSSDSTSGSS
jgi:hypothetical protein